MENMCLMKMLKIHFYIIHILIYSKRSNSFTEGVWTVLQKVYEQYKYSSRCKFHVCKIKEIGPLFRMHALLFVSFWLYCYMAIAE